MLTYASNYNTPILSREYSKVKKRSSLRTLQVLRHKSLEREITTDDKIRAGIGSVIGMAIPLFAMMKHQKVKNPFNLKYGMKEMILLSGASIAGGVSLGMVGEKKSTNMHKLKEGVFQFFNESIPALFVGMGLKYCENGGTKLNTPIAKILTTSIGLVVGMHAAAMLSNKVCDPKDLEPDRKITLKDSIANVDDLIGALVLAKVPIINKLKFERILPVIYSYCGYRAGESN